MPRFPDYGRAAQRQLPSQLRHGVQLQGPRHPLLLQEGGRR